MIANAHSASYIGQTTGTRDSDERVLMHLMSHGTWRFSRPDERGGTVTVPAGSFIVRRDGQPTRFEVSSGATAKVLILPTEEFGSLLDGRHIVGSVRSPVVRVLAAHANMLGTVAYDLGPAGLQSARDALLGLAKGVVRQEFDDAEPLLAPALARAAMNLADSRLADPELSPMSLARELNVSVRTLHRAFATLDESVGTYIRRRRLERARLELVVPFDRPSVMEVAARWHFSDSSHFIRAFRKQYRQTPTEFARLSDTAGGGLEPPYADESPR
ncbi:helix-turn-helix domain-containing protein [Nocardia alni]|uniref:helix-turn-helix domain-containing protein n=1 Tax=Nocardia alni TaxID=2815723 RepID=UPI001C216F41|nr:helix-turn-helix domain-containing protein [Nocardia alni]